MWCFILHSVKNRRRGALTAQLGPSVALFTTLTANAETLLVNFTNNAVTKDPLFFR